ncbi:MAG: universal stress protein [Deltaproteobacteria bacterium]|jgi:nucleotide-binding universal stress UspA family protein|nr:universal stress protein [Deltaproteobacteria bacterium]
MINRILMALKFAPASEFALVKGVELAKIHDAELHIFHAMDYALAELDESAPRLLEEKTGAEKYYLENIKPLVGDLDNVTYKCMPADPGLEVCRQAIQLDADLIVLGCHQLPEKISLGRIDYVGITILEKAPCPVMLIPFPN